MKESPDEQYLKKVSKGVAIVFFGLVISQFLGYLTRLVMVRFYGIEDYGLFTLGNAVLGIAVVVSMLGMHEAITRFVSFYSGKKDPDKVRAVIKSGIKLTLPVSILMALLIIAFSDVIANRFFDEPALGPLLWAFAAMVPLSVLFTNLISVLRGFQLMKYKVYFEDILKSVATLALFFAFFMMGFGIIGAVFSYLIGFVITISVALFVVLRKFPAIRAKTRKVSVNREMLMFAWPLMIAAYIKTVMSWTDTIVLGFFGMAFDVGLYNIAMPTAGIIFMVAVAFRLMLNPVLSELHAKENEGETRTVFRSTSKWIFAITFPMMLLFMLFPDNILGILFGAEAMGASMPLVILTLGFFTLSFIGASSIMLFVIGKTRTIMANTIVATAVNFALNMALIPSMGIIGAAVATASSLILLSVLHIIFCYRHTRLQPVQKSYLKILVSGLVSVSLFYGLIKFVIGSTAWWILVIALPLFLVIYGLLLIRMRSLDRHDIHILKTIEKRIGIRSNKLSRLVSRLT